MSKMSAILSLKKAAKETMRGICHWKNSIVDHSPKLLVLVYHRVTAKVNADQSNIKISEEVFIRQLDLLAKKYPIIALSEALRQSKTGEIRPGCQVVLTFDDGYRDNYDIAFPVLKRKSLPATFFISTDYIGSHDPLWEVEVLNDICRSPGIGRVLIDDITVRKNYFESRLSFALRVFEEMKGTGGKTIKEVIGDLRSRANKDMGLYDYSKDLCINWEQVSDMSESGMEIGSHGASHRSLSRIPFNEALEDIKRSKEAIEKSTGKVCNSLAFPFGSRKDYNQALVDHSKLLGFKSCALNIHGYNNLKPDMYSVKRIIMDEFTDLNHLLG